MVYILSVVHFAAHLLSHQDCDCLENTGLKMPQSAGIISGIQRMVLYETRAVSLSSSFCCYYYHCLTKTSDQSVHRLHLQVAINISLKHHTYM